MAHVLVYVCDDVHCVERLHEGLYGGHNAARPIREQFDAQAQRLFEAHRRGDLRTAVQLRNWMPDLAGSSDVAIMDADLSIDDARLTIAREHGYQHWQHVIDQGADPPDPDFEQAVDALTTGDAPELAELLADDPELARARSSFGHGATLLHYVAANGVETRRQTVPANAAKLTRLLIDSGADVNATANIYGGGATPLSLLLTSAHPAAAGVAERVAACLREAGAAE